MGEFRGESIVALAQQIIKERHAAMRVIFMQILTESKSRNYGTAGEATPDNKARQRKDRT